MWQQRQRQRHMNVEYSHSDYVHGDNNVNHHYSIYNHDKSVDEDD